MNEKLFVLSAVAAATLAVLRWAPQRLALSRAKHRSLAGHSRMAKRLAGWLPGYAYDEAQFFTADAAPAELVQRRRAGFQRLAALYAQSTRKAWP